MRKVLFCSIIIIGILLSGCVGGANEKIIDNSAKTDFTYIINVKTKKFHESECYCIPTVNGKTTHKNRDELINNGYVPCKICKP